MPDLRPLVLMLASKNLIPVVILFLCLGIFLIIYLLYYYLRQSFAPPDPQTANATAKLRESQKARLQHWEVPVLCFRQFDFIIDYLFTAAARRHVEARYLMFTLPNTGVDQKLGVFGLNLGLSSFDTKLQGMEGTKGWFFEHGKIFELQRASFLIHKSEQGEFSEVQLLAESLKLKNPDQPTEGMILVFAADDLFNSAGGEEEQNFRELEKSLKFIEKMLDLTTKEFETPLSLHIMILNAQSFLNFPQVSEPNGVPQVIYPLPYPKSSITEENLQTRVRQATELILSVIRPVSNDNNEVDSNSPQPVRDALELIIHRFAFSRLAKQVRLESFLLN